MISENTPQEGQQPEQPQQRISYCHVENFAASDGRSIRMLTDLEDGSVRFIGMVKGAQVQTMNKPTRHIDFDFIIPAADLREAFDKFVEFGQARFKEICAEISKMQGPANAKIVLAKPGVPLPPGNPGLRIAEGN